MTDPDDANPGFQHGGLGWLFSCPVVYIARLSLHVPEHQSWLQPRQPAKLTANAGTHFFMSSKHFFYTTTEAGETLREYSSIPIARPSFFRLVF